MIIDVIEDDVLADNGMSLYSNGSIRGQGRKPPSALPKHWIVGLCE